MDNQFDWDEDNIRHIARHGIIPEETEQVVANDPLEAWKEEVHDEERLTFIGLTNSARCLTVVMTWRDERIRIVTAFDATPSQRRLYGSERGN